MPAFCDSHTHLVYANSREMEFVDKIRGLSYEEIAKRGGGILNSAKATAAATEDELYNMAQQRLYEVMRMGTGAIEIKSFCPLVENQIQYTQIRRKRKLGAENLIVFRKSTIFISLFRTECLAQVVLRLEL